MRYMNQYKVPGVSTYCGYMTCHPVRSSFQTGASGIHNSRIPCFKSDSRYLEGLYEVIPANIAIAAIPGVNMTEL